MALFEFNTGVLAGTTGTTTNVGFTDNSVDFTLSTVGNPGQGGVFYSPLGGVDGQLSLSDFGVNTGVFTLAVNHPTTDNFSGAQMTMGTFVSGTWTITFVHATNTALNDVHTGINATGQVVTAAAGVYSAIIFTTSSAGNHFLTVDSLTSTIVCYLEGTGIATPDGDVAVEDLRPGDTVLTAQGGKTTVQWVGIQPVETHLVHPARVNPICISAGAIAENVPARDLCVSPDHAIAIDNLLINASALVNGRSIYMVRNMPLEGFTYYHVETEAHEVILAEGCPAESYLDIPDRSSFMNGAERANAPIIQEMDLPRISTRRLVPQRLADQLEARADEIGAQQRRVRAAA